MMDRRGLMAGGLAVLAMGPAIAADKPPSPVAHGILADNALAQAFEPELSDMPDISVVGPSGRRPIRDIKGRAILMPLWAEWCAPCMSELPDFARLQKKYGNDKFAIIPVLTATQKRFTPDLLAKVFALMHCEVFEPLIEYNWGNHLQMDMGQIRGGAALPCNLLIAPDGKIVGREMGAIRDTDAAPAKTYGETLDRAQAGAVQSRWGQSDGEAFAKAMADGFLA